MTTVVSKPIGSTPKYEPNTTTAPTTSLAKTHRMLREMLGETTFNMIRAAGSVEEIASLVLPMTTEDPPESHAFNLDDFVETEIEVTIDSGCCEHVLDLMDAPGYDGCLSESPGSLRGQNFVVGNGQRIRNEGQITLNMETLGADPHSVASTFQVAEVTRPLMSVSRICDQDFKCLFDKTKAEIFTVKSDGTLGDVVCTFKREGGLYVAKLKLKCPSIGKPAPFGRQEP